MDLRKAREFLGIKLNVSSQQIKEIEDERADIRRRLKIIDALEILRECEGKEVNIRLVFFEYAKKKMTEVSFGNREELSEFLRQALEILGENDDS